MPWTERKSAIFYILWEYQYHWPLQEFGILKAFAQNLNKLTKVKFPASIFIPRSDLSCEEAVSNSPFCCCSCASSSCVVWIELRRAMQFSCKICTWNCAKKNLPFKLSYSTGVKQIFWMLLEEEAGFLCSRSQQSTVSYSGAIQETSVHSTQQAPAQDQLLSTQNVASVRDGTFTFI